MVKIPHFIATSRYVSRKKAIRISLKLIQDVAGTVAYYTAIYKLLAKPIPKHIAGGPITNSAVIGDQGPEYIKTVSKPIDLNPDIAERFEQRRRDVCFLRKESVGNYLPETKIY
jgi:hypothetical protein